MAQVTVNIAYIGNSSLPAFRHFLTSPILWVNAARRKCGNYINGGNHDEPKAIRHEALQKVGQRWHKLLTYVRRTQKTTLQTHAKNKDDIRRRNQLRPHIRKTRINTAYGGTMARNMGKIKRSTTQQLADPPGLRNKTRTHNGRHNADFQPRHFQKG